ncbi:MAG: ATP-binding protein [Nanoarchaeota archaeon]
MNFDRESALEGIIRLTPELLVGTTTTQLDEDYLSKSFKSILNHCGNFLGFERAEAFLVRDINRSIRPAFRYKEEALYEDYIASIGYTKEEAEADLKILNSWRENKITLDLDVVHPSSYVLRTGQYIQCYADEESIRKLEERGIVKKKYYEFRIEKYRNYLETIKGKEEPLSFEDWARFAFFPLLREINGNVETIGYVNFEKPLEFLGNKPILEEKMDIAQLTINSAMLPITVSIFADELRKAQAEIINSANLRIIGQLSGGIAHDIGNWERETLATIGYLTDMLKKGKMPERELLEGLEDIKKLSERKLELSEGMNKYARGGSRISKYTSLNESVEDTVRILSSGLERNKIILLTHLDPELPKTEIIASDFNQVYHNLITNATDAIRRKSEISGPDYNPEIRIRTYSEKGEIVSTVYDNGIGIKPENLEQIFEPSFSIKAEVGKGTTGLGLSICRRILRDHKGDIIVRSTPGLETEFRLSLPITEID